MKPILFNTEMVRAILDGRKTVTRRVVKPQPFAVKQNENAPCKSLYFPGDILYVREMFASWIRAIGTTPSLYYKADGNAPDGIKWRPSIHMTRKAARIFLRVTNVRVERLQEITPEQIDAEGCKEWAYDAKTGELLPSDPSWFKLAWNRTIKPSDHSIYRWEANPWVWVIEFERISREEAEKS